MVSSKVLRRCATWPPQPPPTTAPATSRSAGRHGPAAGTHASAQTRRARPGGAVFVRPRAAAVEPVRRQCGNGAGDERWSVSGAGSAGRPRPAAGCLQLPAPASTGRCAVGCPPCSLPLRCLQGAGPGAAARKAAQAGGQPSGAAAAGTAAAPAWPGRPAMEGTAAAAGRGAHRVHCDNERLPAADPRVDQLPPRHRSDDFLHLC